MMDQDDFMLLNLVKKGDESAFKKIFDHYYEPLCLRANTLVKNYCLAEELVSDLLYSIWSNREQMEIRSNLKGYLYAAVRNKCLNVLKSRKIHFCNIDTIDYQIQSDWGSPNQYMLFGEFEKQWESRINELPTKRQKVFRMSRFEGKSNHEIADVLKVSEYTVRNQVQIALKTLAQYN